MTFAANFSPIPRVAPLPLGRLIEGGEEAWPPSIQLLLFDFVWLVTTYQLQKGSLLNVEFPLMVSNHVKSEMEVNKKLFTLLDAK